MKTENWDNDGNWIGDDIENSIDDWGVKSQSTASVGDLAAVTKNMLIVVVVISARIAVFVLVLWLALWIIGVV